MNSRFIPACAGNSGVSGASAGDMTVHPRLRGELWTLEEALNEVIWFIPACAGNSCLNRININQPPVHPRLRGELAKRLRIRTPQPGSSPLARGTRTQTLRCNPGGRFIPACAGNSDVCKALSIQNAVHPRLRGELITTNGNRFGPRGSSPLARGTRQVECSEKVSKRFIPACAGNSLKMVTTLH